MVLNILNNIAAEEKILLDNDKQSKFTVKHSTIQLTLQYITQNNQALENGESVPECTFMFLVLSIVYGKGIARETEDFLDTSLQSPA